MTSKASYKHYDRIGLLMVVAVVLVTGVVFLWTRAEYLHNNTSVDTVVDTRGHLHVLGITLGTTTLKQAEIILKSKSDVALYIYPKEDPKAGLKLEAFFPSIADHTKVVLLLNVPQQTLHAIESRATLPHLYPNAVARMNLAAIDTESVKEATVSELTLIPSLKLTPGALKARFGLPDDLRHLNEQQDQYSYDSIGLQATLSKEGQSILHFSNPVSGM